MNVTPQTCRRNTWPASAVVLYAVTFSRMTFYSYSPHFA
jgi:hypothetical protein